MGGGVTKQKGGKKETSGKELGGMKIVSEGQTQPSL